VARHVELTLLLLLDAVALALAWAAFPMIQSGEAFPLVDGSGEAFVLPPVGVLLAFWGVLFLFAGLYRERYAASRLDELTSVLKVVSAGVLLLFFAGFIGRVEVVAAREGLFVYWALTLGLVGAGRLSLRSAQKALLVSGKGVHKAVIVGWTDQVEAVYREVQRYPAAGLRVVGAVRLHREPLPELVATTPGGAASYRAYAGGGGGDGALSFGPDGLAAQAHAMATLPDLIERLGVQDVLIALGPDDHACLDEVLRVCDGVTDHRGRPIALKLVPDFYAAVGGMARTEHMYGLPLIEVLPVPTPAWERHAKRIIDIAVSAAVLLAALPLWIAVALAVRGTSPGPAVYRQVRVGLYGRPFTMYKFRTMENDAERHTGPVWACRGDLRVTPLGRWLRALRLDEIPQLVNVLKGEMSLVGPRPERPTFVETLAQEIPLYSRRHRVKPGATGLAQVKWRYDQDLEDVRQKLKYDLLYIEHMSLRMDLQIMLQTFRTMLARQGQ